MGADGFGPGDRAEALPGRRGFDSPGLHHQHHEAWAGRVPKLTRIQLEARIAHAMEMGELEPLRPAPRISWAEELRLRKLLWDLEDLSSPASRASLLLTASGRARGGIHRREVATLSTIPERTVHAFADGAFVDGSCGCGVVFAPRKDGRLITRELSLTALPWRRAWQWSSATSPATTSRNTTCGWSPAGSSTDLPGPPPRARSRPG